MSKAAVFHSSFSAISETDISQFSSFQEIGAEIGVAVIAGPLAVEKVFPCWAGLVSLTSVASPN